MKTVKYYNRQSLNLLESLHYLCDLSTSHCPDYDLCEGCEAIEGVHDANHVFLKLKRPAIKSGHKMEPLLCQPLYDDKAVPSHNYR